jgi:ribosomal protein S18 acetylase RimI-like enzyme
MNVKWNHRLAELIEDWRNNFKVYPWRRALSAMFKRLLQLPYRHTHYLIFAVPLPENLPDLSDFHFADSTVIRRFESQDISEVAKISRPSEAKLCAQRLARGQVGLSAIHNNQLVGFSWACAEIDPTIDKFGFSLGPLDYFTLHAYTSPPFRRKGIQTSMALAQYKIFSEMGYKRAICHIRENNRPSQQHVRNIGGYQVGDIEIIRIGPWRRVRTHFNENFKRTPDETE